MSRYTVPMVWMDSREGAVGIAKPSMTSVPAGERGTTTVSRDVRRCHSLDAEGVQGQFI